MGKFVVSKPENKRTSFAARHMGVSHHGGEREIPTRASYARGGMIRHRFDDGGQVDQMPQEQPQEQAPAAPTGTFDTPTGSKIGDLGTKALGMATNALYQIPGIGQGLQFVGDNAENLVKKAFNIKDKTLDSAKQYEKTGVPAFFNEHPDMGWTGNLNNDAYSAWEKENTFDKHQKSHYDQGIKNEMTNLIDKSLYDNKTGKWAGNVPFVKNNDAVRGKLKYWASKGYIDPRYQDVYNKYSSE